MKSLARILTTTTATLAVFSILIFPDARADKKKKEAKHEHKHDHDHASVAGPNGGRIIHEVEPHAELLVTKDRKLQVTILDGKLKPAAPGKQKIAVVCGKRTSPTRMKFEKKGKSFLSDKPLPKGMNIPTIVRIQMDPKEKPTTVRLNLNLEDCPSCDYLEYACICDHHHEGDGHKHEKK